LSEQEPSLSLRLAAKGQHLGPPRGEADV
jgi:hypothetical protein